MIQIIRGLAESDDVDLHDLDTMAQGIRYFGQIRANEAAAKVAVIETK